jgi:hypothetical protein
LKNPPVSYTMCVTSLGTSVKELSGSRPSIPRTSASAMPNSAGSLIARKQLRRTDGSTSRRFPATSYSALGSNGCGHASRYARSGPESTEISRANWDMAARAETLPENNDGSR